MSSDKKTYGSTCSDDILVGQMVDLPTSTSWLKRFELGESSGFLYSADLKPVPSHERVWRWYNYVCFWISDAMNVNAWQIAGSGVAMGLSWWQAWLSVWVGYSCAALFVVLVARPGTYYHIPFPVSVRSSFGIVGSAWPVLNRVMMAIVWFACQTWIFGQSIQLIVRAIWGNQVVHNIPAFLGALLGSEASVGHFEYLCYLGAWAITLPFIWFPPSSIRHLFTVKTIVVPIAALGFLVWAMVLAWETPASTVAQAIIAQAPASSTNSVNWKFVAACMNGVANFAAMIVNSPDFSRFADKPTAPTWSQFITIPCAFSATAIVGILISTCAGRIYGRVYWSPLDVLDRFLDDETIGNRLGVFFIASALGLASIGTNICANSLSAGTDMSALLPRFINIRRGGYVCATLAFFLRPWNFFASSNKFTAYLGSYSVFLSCVAGIMVADYYVVRRAYLELASLYSSKHHSPYMFGGCGINWRAYTAYALGVLPNLGGFLHVFGRPVGPLSEMIYRFNYFVGFTVAALSYILLSWMFPVEAAPIAGWHEENQFVDDFDARMLIY